MVVISYASPEIYVYNLKLSYKEFYNRKVIDEDFSNLGDILGIGIKYSIKYIFDCYINFKYASGDSYYNGFNLKGKNVKFKQSGFYLLNLEAGVGKNFYIFFGYREWNRGKSNNPDDYDEKYYWNYIGFKYSYKFNFNKFYFYPEVGYNLAINPKLKIKLGNEPTLNLGNTTGGFIEMPFYFKWRKNIEIKVFYRYEYWHINPSDISAITINNTKYPIFEPESKTKNQYFGIGINFNF